MVKAWIKIDYTTPWFFTQQHSFKIVQASFRTLKTRSLFDSVLIWIKNFWNNGILDKLILSLAQKSEAPYLLGVEFKHIKYLYVFKSYDKL